jgi:predicted lysophospholipase L1 biosynthesis ABC-type transport system permease subunit
MIRGVAGRLVPVRIVDGARYFPTANPQRGGFIVADLEALLRHLRMVSPAASLTPNELIVTHAPGAGEAVAESLVEIVGRAAPVQIYDRTASLKAISLDPLISAGWKAMVVVSIAVIIFAATLGYVTYLLAFSARNRGEMAALRSVGVSKGQMLALLSMEHLVIAALGIGLGTWAGFQMSALMVSAIAVTEDGAAVLPPFRMVTDWAIMGPVYVALAGIFVVSIVALYRSVTGMSLHKAAREDAR